MANRDMVIDRIKRVPMFAACTRHELQAIGRLATEVHIDDGRVLMTEGEIGSEFMVVLEGTAIATKNGQPLATFGPGDFFGEVALLDPGPRTATVVATSPMMLAVVGQAQFNQILEEVPTLARKVMRGLAQRLREADAEHI